MPSPKPADFPTISSGDVAMILKELESSGSTSVFSSAGVYIQQVGLPTPFSALLTILFLCLFSIRDLERKTNSYPRQFVSSRGNEYFCEIDEEYLTDRFNLTGLNTEVHYYQHALDLVNDVFDLDCDDEMREAIEKSARHLYGLVHARYIVTTRGLAKMVSQPYPKPLRST
jgi:Casein kinase II regulatory subunit